jgi:alanyl-tRNA synthetase
MTITREELIEKYVSFFKEKNHAQINGASLIPENDPTVLFTTAGMHPLVPYLMGETHPNGKRLVNVQKCIRTGDIDDVGDKWHLTFFEMLGNWSLGNYFKKEAIEMSFEFLTGKNWLNIPIERLSVTCFEGDNDSPKDLEAENVWLSLGMPKERIHFLSKEDNWWGPAGTTGPCGPDTEMFYHVQNVQEKDTIEFNKFCKEGKFCEIWNDVFMQYNKTVEGKYVELEQKNVDTGMGVERVVAVLNGFDNVYECDSLKPIYEKVKELSKKELVDETSIKSARIITDHLRAATFILGDDKAIVPSNVDQGYILRRFIRRSIRHARLLGIEGKFCRKIVEIVVDRFGEAYPDLKRNKDFIFSEIEKEEEKFSIALEKGTKILETKLFFLEKSAGNSKNGKKELNGKGCFDLFQSYGFPLEMTVEMCAEKGFTVDTKAFEEMLKEHQELSRKGAEQKFKGGLADAKEETTKLHTAAHLMLSAMRTLISNKIVQKGSNITSERLRFDFNSEERLTDEQLRSIEDWVNNVIKSEADVKEELVTLEEARQMGAHGTFDSKYGEKVKVYTVYNGNKVFSKEICGGPHVKTTKGMGKFKILKQEAVAVGIKRVKAVLE